MALFAIADDDELDGWVRILAEETLRRAYPRVADRLGSPDDPAAPLGVAAGIAASSLATGVLLSSVGAFGQFEAGEAVGGVGGGLIGAGAGWLYAASEPVTEGQGLAFASGVGWGLAAGLMATWAAVPADAPSVTDEQRRLWGAAFRAIGVGAGAGVGAVLLRKDPQPSEVLEIDLAGYTGSQIAWGLSRLALGPDPEIFDPWANPGSTVGPDDLARRDRIRTGAALAGTIVGLGLGAILAETWQLEPADGAMGAVAAAQGAWLGGWIPSTYELGEADGHVHTGMHLGLAAGLVATAFGETSGRQVAVAGFGALAGNALGAGLGFFDGPLLASQIMLPMGTAGLVAGGLLAETLAPDGRDASMIGVGTALATAQGIAVGSWLDDADILGPDEAAGVALTAGGLSALGFMAAAPFVHPDPAAMAFLASGAAWGTWFGALGPAALGADWRSGERILVGTLVADAFLVGSGVLVSPLVGLEPERTLGAQLGGVAGATVGALGAGLATGEAQPVAAAALGGTLVGMGVGAVISENLRQRRAGSRSTGLSPRLRLPGHWAPTMAPRVLEDGSTALVVGVQGSGW